MVHIITSVWWDTLNRNERGGFEFDELLLLDALRRVLVVVLGAVGVYFLSFCTYFFAAVSVFNFNNPQLLASSHFTIFFNKYFTFVLLDGIYVATKFNISGRATVIFGVTRGWDCHLLVVHIQITFCEGEDLGLVLFTSRVFVGGGLPFDEILRCFNYHSIFALIHIRAHYFFRVLISYNFLRNNQSAL